MTTDLNRRIVLAARPHGRPTAEHFRLEKAPVPEPGADQMMCRTISRITGLPGCVFASSTISLNVT